MRGSLDTNAILRLIVGDDAAQARKVTQLLSKANSQVAVAYIALTEAIYVLQRYYHVERDDIASLISNFMNLPVINCNRVLFDRALVLYTEHPALSVEDCCLAVYAALNDATPLHTFDKKLASQLEHTALIA